MVQRDGLRLWTARLGGINWFAFRSEPCERICVYQTFLRAQKRFEPILPDLLLLQWVGFLSKFGLVGLYMNTRGVVSIRLIKTRENGFELNEDRKVVYRRRPPQQILLHFFTQLEGLSHNDTYDIDQVKASWHLASHLARKAGRDGLIVSVKPVLFHVRAGSCRELASQALLALVWGCH